MQLGGGSPTAAARDAAAAAALARAGQSPATTRDVKAIAIVHRRARHEVSVATIEELQQTCRATFSIAPQIPLRFVDSLTNADIEAFEDIDDGDASLQMQCPKFGDCRAYHIVQGSMLIAIPRPITDGVFRIF